MFTLCALWMAWLWVSPSPLSLVPMPNAAGTGGCKTWRVSACYLLPPSVPWKSVRGLRLRRYGLKVFSWSGVCMGADRRRSKALPEQTEYYSHH